MDVRGCIECPSSPSNNVADRRTCTEANSRSGRKLLPLENAYVFIGKRNPLDMLLMADMRNSDFVLAWSLPRVAFGFARG